MVSYKEKGVEKGFYAIILCFLRHLFYNSPPTAWIIMRFILFYFYHPGLSFYYSTCILGFIFGLLATVYMFFAQSSTLPAFSEPYYLALKPFNMCIISLYFLKQIFCT